MISSPSEPALWLLDSAPHAWLRGLSVRTHGVCLGMYVCAHVWLSVWAQALWVVPPEPEDTQKFKERSNVISDHLLYFSWCSETVIFYFNFLMLKGVWYIFKIAPKYNFLLFSLIKLRGGWDSFWSWTPLGWLLPCYSFFPGSSDKILLFMGIRFMYFIVVFIICSCGSRRHATMRYTGTVGSISS